LSGLNETQKCRYIELLGFNYMVQIHGIQTPPEKKSGVRSQKPEEKPLVS